MVNRAFLEKGYRSRPRRSIAVRGFVSLLVVGLALAFLFLYLHQPDLFAFLDQVQTSYPEASSTLRDLLDYYYAHFLLTALLLLYPLTRLVKTASLRALHWLLAAPALFLEIGLIALWACFGIPPVAENFDASLVIDMQTKYMGAAIYGQIGLLAFASLLEMFYCAFPCVKYRKIYRLRAAAIAYARRHRGESGYRTPAQVKRDFYRFYQKKDYDALLRLLYVHVVEKVGSGKLDEGEFRYFVSHVAKLDGTIREAELKHLYEKGDFALMKSIYDRLATRASSPECGPRKAAEDAAYERLSREGETRAVPPVSPRPETSAPQAVNAKAPVSSTPIPPPSAVGEAWRKEKK